jgi:4'-phosphopantetheinyl transferase
MEKITAMNALSPTDGRPTYALDEADVALWLVRLTAVPPAMIEGTQTLSLAEHAAGARFQSTLLQTRFLQRRVALRAILAGYLGVSATELVFMENEFGKPALHASLASTGLSFNSSHSGPVAVIAVGRSRHIGIDVEAVRPIKDAEKIAARFFSSQESAALAALDPDERNAGFLHCWTRKEAVIKALGGGLSIPLDSFAVSLQPHQPAAILAWSIPDTDAAPWRLYHLEPTAGFVGALLVEGTANLSAWQQWPRGIS